MTKTDVTWEALRRWEVVRYLVYYLTENLVPPELVTGKRIVDFSCGIGDLSKYFVSCGAEQVIATQPETGDPPALLQSVDEVEFRSGIEAKQIESAFPEESIDLFVARMVFQFPTEEAHYIDVDGMLRQVHKILRPGGRLIVCTHEYTEIADEPSLYGLSLEEHLVKVLAPSSGPERTRREGLVELIRTIGLPPREGVHGQTGFGLKAIMFVDSVVQHGFQVESCAEIEDFTFPTKLAEAMDGDLTEFTQLAEQVFRIKQEEILSEGYRDKYKRPQVLQRVLKRISELHSFVTLPIFSVEATKP